VRCGSGWRRGLFAKYIVGNVEGRSTFG